MSKSKKIFLIIAGLFFAIVLYFVIDIGRRTTFPGQKNTPPKDSVKVPENHSYE